jgi:hypothetical protein
MATGTYMYCVSGQIWPRVGYKWAKNGLSLAVVHGCMDLPIVRLLI